MLSDINGIPNIFLYPWELEFRLIHREALTTDFPRVNYYPSKEDSQWDGSPDPSRTDLDRERSHLGYFHAGVIAARPWAERSIHPKGWVGPNPGGHARKPAQKVVSWLLTLLYISVKFGHERQPIHD